MKIAINKNIINKATEKQQFAKLTHTFENVDITQQDLADLINQGFAFCAQHKNSHRKSTNFTVSNFIAVDIDHGLSIDNALNHPFVKQYASIFYTTPSHTNDNHRFRLIFELDRDIDNPVEMKNAYKGVSKKFGGDPACKDACRLFFGSKDSAPKVFGATLPNHILDEIILFGLEGTKQFDTRKHDQKGIKGRDTIRSSAPLEEDTIVADEDGFEHRLGDLGPGIRIHCPKHIDNRPSAFTLLSQTGVLGVHCSTCNATYFIENDTPSYDFNYSLNNLDALDDNRTLVVNPGSGSVTDNSSITRMEKRYLSAPDKQADITFIKSPKGSGKTQYLEKVVSRCKREGKRILLIGHRQSLIRSVSRRLGLKSYISHKFSTGAGDGNDVLVYESPSKHFAICADSLSTTLNPKNHHYDVVLIDEVEQVISHLTGDTVKDRRLETFHWFKHYISQAKELYVLDADLNYLTVNTLHGLINDKNKSIHFLVNEWTCKGQALFLFEDKMHLKQDLMEALERNETCFVCSNSKAEVHRLEKYIQAAFGDSRRIVAVTSENSNDSDVQEFIKQIKTEILKYDVVIASPSMGTGIDITFPEEASKIDHVYGFFESRINTHFDIDQQLSRVRHPGSVKVWISPEKFHFETLPLVIKKEIEREGRKTKQLIGISPDGTCQYNNNDDYLNLWVDVVSMQRGSKNNLKYHFQKLRKHNGLAITDVQRDDDLAALGLAAHKEGKELCEEEWVERILNAPLVTKKEYKYLIKKNNKARLSSKERDAMRRYEIESFYLTKATKDLIEQDDNGRYRGVVVNYGIYNDPDSKLVAQDQSEEQREIHEADKRHYVLWKRTMKEILESAGLANEESLILTNTIIRGDQLTNFIKICVKQEQRIAQLFDISTRGDIKRKPIQQLNRVLGLMGLSARKVRTIKEGGKKIYLYSISQESVDSLNTITERRNDTDLRDQWHTKRENTKQDRLFTKDSPLLMPRTFRGVYGRKDPILSLVQEEVET